MKKLMTKKMGMILLGVWLIATGLLQIVSISIPAAGVILAILAIVTGLLLLLGKG